MFQIQILNGCSSYNRHHGGFSLKQSELKPQYNNNQGVLFVKNSPNSSCHATRNGAHRMMNHNPRSPPRVELHLDSSLLVPVIVMHHANLLCVHAVQLETAEVHDRRPGLEHAIAAELRVLAPLQNRVDHVGLAFANDALPSRYPSRALAAAASESTGTLSRNNGGEERETSSSTVHIRYTTEFQPLKMKPCFMQATENSTLALMRLLLRCCCWEESFQRVGNVQRRTLVLCCNKCWLRVTLSEHWRAPG
jgi:hypothetical protein